MPLIVRLAMVFAGGTVAGIHLPWAGPALVACAWLGLLLLLRFEAREELALAAFAAAGMAFGALHTANLGSGCSRLADREPLTLTGVLATSITDARRTVRVRVTSAWKCTAEVRVRMPDDAPTLVMGDAVRITGKWMTLRVSGDPRGSPDGLVIASSVHPDRHASASPLLRARGRTQQRIHDLFPATYPLADALLVAQRENLSADVRERFAASGLTHLLAISGTHVALIAASLLLMARLLRRSNRAVALTALAGTAAYVGFLGAPYAALRSLLQMALVLASRGLQRPVHPLGPLAVAAIVITAIDPSAPFDAGFQLSFAGICGIVLWRRPLAELLPKSLPAGLRDAIATTVAATAVTTPIAAVHFGVVSGIAVMANLLAIPVVSVAVPTAAAAVLLSGVNLPAARLVASGAELPLLALDHIARQCALVPAGHFFATPAAVICGTLAVALAFHSLRARFRSTLPGTTAIALLAGSLPIVAAPLLNGTHRLEIHMIDVGQGDAFAIRSPRGRWLLVDAGPVSDRFDAGRRDVVPFLLHHQARRLEAVILSHPHLDHFGGLAAVARSLKVRAVIDPGLPVSSPAFDSLLSQAARRRIPWLVARPGATVDIDGMRLELLTPDSVLLDATADANDFSAAFRLSYGQFTALFLGDMPAARERRLVRQLGDRANIDLLKVAHHGSAGASAPELIEAASPSVALISVGRRNRYRHPSPRVLARLEAYGARVFRTDQDGTVSVYAQADGRMQIRTAQ